jgi:hypothetical protein
MQPELIDTAPRSTWTPVAATAIGVGAVIGSLGRGLPLVVADLLHRGEPLPECDGGGPVGCTFVALPDVIGELLVLGLIMLVITTLLAVAGVLLGAIGWSRRVAQEDVVDVPGVALLTAGAALVMPAIWLAFAVVVWSLG